MAHPTAIIINNATYAIESEAIWTDVTAQIENYVRTGRQLLRIQYAKGYQHVLLNDATDLKIWQPSE